MTGFKRALRVGLLGAGAAILTGATDGPMAAETPPTTTSAVQGLEQDGEILIDRWGVPHIYAQTAHDVLFLQGYNAARDRLWQIDLWRKRGLGLLAHDFGPDYVAQDRAARLLLYRGDMGREWASYGPDAHRYADAFTDGINAYVDAIEQGQAALPREFTLAGTKPDRWSAEDIVRIRSHGLIGNVEDEVARARTICAAGIAGDAYRLNLEPSWQTHVPAGFDPCGLPPDVLQDYTLGTRSMLFEALGRARKGGGAPEPAEITLTDRRVDVIGSNNWVIGGGKTASGRPILANDPHRAHGAPSLRYIVHLNAPGLSVIGAGEPMLPGISIGHNDAIAFGLTIFAIDQEDLYQYDLAPGAADSYRYGAQFEPMRTITEAIEVKGEAPREVTLQFTRHGPVLKVDPRTGRAWALRSAWLEPGTAAYFGSLSYMTARNWGEFSTAMERWGSPAENQVYADTAGNIGWIAGGLTPRRTNFDGLLPVPGDGRYEWQGFLPGSALPRSFNPAQGWFATANQMNLPPGYPIDERRIGFEWADPSRHQRISEVLSRGKKLTVADSVDLQTDMESPLDRRFVQLIRDARLVGADASERRAIDLVANWDGRATSESVAATIAAVWLNRQLGTAATKALYPDAASVIGRPTTGSLIDLLAKPDARFGNQPAERRNEILLTSLRAALREIADNLGDDPSTWSYGRLYTARFTHALAPLAPEDEAQRMTIGPFPMRGTWSAPIASSFSSRFRLSAGASFRMVLDVGEWDASRAVNTPGQSGSPESPHFADLADLWHRGDTFPLLYSREAVLASTESRILLRAGPPPVAKEIR